MAKYRGDGTDGARTVSDAVVIKEVFATNLHNDKTFMYSIQEGDEIDSVYSISIFLRQQTMQIRNIFKKKIDLNVSIWSITLIDPNKKTADFF